MAKTLNIVLALVTALATAAPVHAQETNGPIAAAQIAEGMRASNTGLDITVFAAHYVLAGKTFDNLDALESAVKVSPSGPVTLTICGPGASRSLMAAAHRFRDGPLYLRVFEMGVAACPAAPSLARHAVQMAAQAPYGIDDEAVGRYWRNLMP